MEFAEAPKLEHLEPVAATLIVEPPVTADAAVEDIKPIATDNLLALNASDADQAVAKESLSAEEVVAVSDVVVEPIASGNIVGESNEAPTNDLQPTMAHDAPNAEAHIVAQLMEETADQQQTANDATSAEPQIVAQVAEETTAGEIISDTAETETAVASVLHEETAAIVEHTPAAELDIVGQNPEGAESAAVEVHAEKPLIENELKVDEAMKAGEVTEVPAANANEAGEESATKTDVEEPLHVEESEVSKEAAEPTVESEPITVVDNLEQTTPPADPIVTPEPEAEKPTTNAIEAIQEPAQVAEPSVEVSAGNETSTADVQPPTGADDAIAAEAVPHAIEPSTAGSPIAAEVISEAAEPLPAENPIAGEVISEATEPSTTIIEAEPAKLLEIEPEATAMGEQVTEVEALAPEKEEIAVEKQTGHADLIAEAPAAEPAIEGAPAEDSIPQPDATQDDDPIEVIDPKPDAPDATPTEA